MNLVGTYEMKCNYICMYKGANRYQKVVDQNGRESNFGVYQTTLPKNLLLKGYFCPEQELSALNFRGGAEKW